jgi:hypothetical protein
MMPKSNSQKRSSIVSTLRRKIYLAHVCTRAEIKERGSQMERFFEPENITTNKQTNALIRSCKYDRYFKGTNPSQSTISLIEKRMPETAQLYYTPLWHAIDLLLGHTDDYLALFSQLSLALQCVIFEMKPNSQHQLERVVLTAKHIDKLGAIGELDGLACLIALRAENDKLLLNVSLATLDKAIFNGLICCDTAQLGNEIFALFKKCVKPISYDSATCWNIEIHELLATIETLKTATTNAINLRIIVDRCTLHPFQHLLLKGNTTLIVRELSQLSEAAIHLRKKESLGLVWLVLKLKSYHLRSDHFILDSFSRNHTEC